MKRSYFRSSPISVFLPELMIAWLLVSVVAAGVLVSFVVAQDEEADEAEEVKDPDLVYANDFEKAKPGPVSYFVLDGDFEIEAAEGEDAGQVLKLLPSPLVEASIQFGTSLDEGGTVKVRAKADKRGRSYPRFGVGMHGLKGYRLRVAPAAEQLELVRDSEVIQSVAFDWLPGVWYFVELAVLENNKSWTVSGRVWAENEARPDDAQIDYISVEPDFRGKASIIGTPYAELPIYYDDLEIRKKPGAAEE